jgi:Flp pilus assembly protein TadB
MPGALIWAFVGTMLLMVLLDATGLKPSPAWFAITALLIVLWLLIGLSLGRKSTQCNQQFSEVIWFCLGILTAALLVFSAQIGVSLKIAGCFFSLGAMWRSYYLEKKRRG